MSKQPELSFALCLSGKGSWALWRAKSTIDLLHGLLDQLLLGGCFLRLPLINLVCYKWQVSRVFETGH